MSSGIMEESIKVGGGDQPENDNSTTAQKNIQTEELLYEALGHESFAEPMVHNDKEYKPYVICDWDSPGHVVIFSHLEFEPNTGQKRREGTQKDEELLKDLFGDQLGYTVHIHRDLTRDEIRQQLHQMSNEVDHSSSGSLVVIVLTHGSSGSRLWARDNVYLSSDVWTPFISCPSLEGKPKIFVFQACRGPESEARHVTAELAVRRLPHVTSVCNNLQHGTMPHARDVFVAYSSVEGFESKRHVKDGTWYINVFCDEMTRWGEGHADLITSMTRVTQNMVENFPNKKLVSSKQGQTPCFVSYLGHSVHYRKETSMPARDEDILLYSNSARWRGEAIIYHDESHAKDAQLLQQKLNDLGYTAVPRRYMIKTGNDVLDNLISVADNFWYDEALIIAILGPLEFIVPQIKQILGVKYSLAGKPKIILSLDIKEDGGKNLMETDTLTGPTFTTTGSDYLVVRGYGQKFFNHLIRTMRTQQNIISCLSENLYCEIQTSEASSRLSSFESSLRYNFFLQDLQCGTQKSEVLEELTKPGIEHELPDRNQHFHGREEMLERLNQLLSVKTAGRNIDVTLTGMSGVGKSQLALEFVHKYRWKYCNIIWISAQDSLTITQSFINLAERCQIINDRNTNDITKLVNDVYDYFRYNSKSLFIFDDAVKMKNDDSSQGIEDFLPTYVGKSKMFFLITSKYTQWEGTKINVDVFTDNEALSFLSKNIKLKTTTEELEELSKIFGGLPLSLSVASSYINETTCTVSSYINDIKNNIELTGQENALQESWTFTVKHVEKQDFGPEALTVMKVFSYCLPVNIPNKLVTKLPQNDKIVKAILLLSRFSLINLVKNGKSNMHSQLQNLTHKIVEQSKEKSKILSLGLKLFIKHLITAKTTDERNLPDGFLLHAIHMFKNIYKIQNLLSKYEYFPVILLSDLKFNYLLDLAETFGRECMQAYHNDRREFCDQDIVLSCSVIETVLMKGKSKDALQQLDQLENCVSELEEELESLTKWTVKLLRFDILERLGKYEDAIRLLQDCLTNPDSNLQDDMILNGRCKLANIYSLTGKYLNSLTILNELLKIYESKLGIDHYQTSYVRENVAQVLSLLGQYEESLKMQENVYNVRKTNLGDDHLRTKESRRLIIQNYREMGKLDLAINMLQEDLEYEKSCLGLDHPTVTGTISYISGVYIESGRVKEGTSMLQDVLVKNLELNGESHPHTLLSKINLGEILFSSGKFIEALKIFTEVFDTSASTLGDENPITLTAKYDIGRVKDELGEFEEAENIFNYLIEVFEKNCGSHHPHTLVKKQAIAKIKLKLGKFSEALAVLQSVRDNAEEKFGSHNKIVLAARLNISATLETMGDYTNAISELKSLITFQEENIGVHHPITLEAKLALAALYENMGKHEDSMLINEEVLQFYTKSLGKNHIKTLNAQNNIANNYLYLKKYDIALKILSEALEISEENFGANSKYQITRAILLNKASIYREIGKSTEALEIYYDVLRICKEIWGDNYTEEMLVTLNNIALILECTGKIDESLEMHKKCCSVLITNFGDDHPKTLVSKYNVALLLEKSGAQNKALIMYENIEKLQTSRLGAFHFQTIATKLSIASVYQDIENFVKSNQVITEIEKNMYEHFPPEHPVILKVIVAKSDLLIDMQNYEEAISALKGVLQIQENKFGKSHDDTLLSIMRMGNFLQKSGDLDGALKYYKEFESQQLLKVNKINSNIISVKNKISVIYLLKDKFEEALSVSMEILNIYNENPEYGVVEKLQILKNIGHLQMQLENFEISLKTYEKVNQEELLQLGPSNIATLGTKLILAELCRQCDKYEAAVEHYKFYLHHHTISTDEENTANILVKRRLADLYDDMGNFVEALPLTEEVLRFEIDSYGCQHYDTMETRNNLAGIKAELGKYEEALIDYQQVMTDMEQTCGSDNPDLITTRYNLGELYLKMGRNNDALREYKLVNNICKQIYGPDNDLSKSCRKKIKEIKKATK